MAIYQLITLGSTQLTGPHGPVQFDEPPFVALIVMLAAAGAAGMTEGELMLRLTPSAKPEAARTELMRLIALARSRLGDEAVGALTANSASAAPGVSTAFAPDALAAGRARGETRYALVPGWVELDVEVRDVAVDRPRDDFLAGFKLPGSPEFREWLVATRSRVVPRPIDITPPLPGRRRLAGRRGLLLAALGIAVAGGTATVLSREATPTPVAGFAAGDPVLLADLRNETGDTLFDRGIITAATVALQQSQHLRLYSRSRLPGVYARMQIANRDTALTFELAQEVAERDGVRFVLGLVLDRTADGYRVTARLADVEGQQAVTETGEPAESEAGILAAVDRVLLTIRARLGESRSDLRERRSPLPLVTTASLEALRSYSDGGRAWYKGEFRLASEFWLRAADLDTGFAMANGALGSYYYYHHDRAKGEFYFSKALQNSGRLTEFERLQLQERWAGYRGDRDSSVALSGIIATRFPNVVTWYDHGTALMQADRDEEARVALRKALDFDSAHVNSWINLATASKSLGKLEEALDFYASAAAVDSMVLYRGNLNNEWGGTLVRLGRLAAAESAFRRMSTRPVIYDRSLGMRSMGYLALWQGRFGQSIEFFGKAVDATVQSQTPLSEARNRLLRASAYRIANREREANADVSKALALMSSPSHEPSFLAMMAFSCVRLGRTADTDSVLRVLRTRVDTNRKVDLAALAFVEGAAALSRNQPDSALAFLRKADALPQSVHVLALTGDAYRALGLTDSVRVTTQRILQNPGFGFEGQDEWLLARRALGDLLLAGGDSAGAATEYRKFIDQWRDAPSALPVLAVARGRLADTRR